MLKEKCIRVALTEGEKNILTSSAEILDELADAIGDVISAAGYYDIDLADLRDTIKAIVYEGVFEIDE